MLLEAINDFKAEEIIFIGDKSSDRDAAMNAGIKFIRV
jgi:phosphoglycolate phosphatase-like HAD superfamily hydrolase